jgi:hypothetical protein
MKTRKTLKHRNARRRLQRGVRMWALPWVTWPGIRRPTVFHPGPWMICCTRPLALERRVHSSQKPVLVRIVIYPHAPGERPPRQPKG